MSLVLGIQLKKDLTFPSFVDWYKEKNKEAFELSAINSEITAPLEYGKYFTQRFSALIGKIRDESAVEVTKAQERSPSLCSKAV